MYVHAHTVATYIHTGITQNHYREIKMYLCLINSFKETDTEFLQKASAASCTVLPAASWKDSTTAGCVCCHSVTDCMPFNLAIGDGKAMLCCKVGAIANCHETKHYLAPS